jgi:hypothetical protein
MKNEHKLINIIIKSKGTICVSSQMARIVLVKYFYLLYSGLVGVILFHKPGCHAIKLPKNDRWKTY